jgi:hypothetical protein
VPSLYPLCPQWLDAQPVAEQAGKLRPLALLLVLEVHEDVAAVRSLAPDHISPAADVVGRVALVSETEIRVVGREPNRCRKPLAVGDTQRQVSCFEPLVDLLVQPRCVPELERGADFRRQIGEKRVEDREA